MLFLRQRVLVRGERRGHRFERGRCSAPRHTAQRALICTSGTVVPHSLTTLEMCITKLALVRFLYRHIALPPPGLCRATSFATRAQPSNVGVLIRASRFEAPGVHDWLSQRCCTKCAHSAAVARRAASQKAAQAKRGRARCLGRKGAIVQGKQDALASSSARARLLRHQRLPLHSSLMRGASLPFSARPSRVVCVPLRLRMSEI